MPTGMGDCDDESLMGFFFPNEGQKIYYKLKIWFIIYLNFLYLITVKCSLLKNLANVENVANNYHISIAIFVIHFVYEKKNKEF